MLHGVKLAGETSSLYQTPNLEIQRPKKSKECIEQMPYDSI